MIIYKYNFNDVKVETMEHKYWGGITGVDLLKILGGKTKILEGQKMVKSDKCMGLSQLLGGTCPGCPSLSLRLLLLVLCLLGRFKCLTSPFLSLLSLFFQLSISFHH